MKSWKGLGVRARGVAGLQSAFQHLPQHLQRWTGGLRPCSLATARWCHAEENHGVNNTDILGNANSLLGSYVSGDIGYGWWFCGAFNPVYFSNSLTKHCFRSCLIYSSQLSLFPFPLVSTLRCHCEHFLFCRC